MKTIGTTAKASFTSHRSTSSTAQPTLLSRSRTAGTGAVVNHFGACAHVACPTMRARAVNPWACAALSEASTKAAAPSDMDEAFAAVTVPPLRNAGLSKGILSARARPGCSSWHRGAAALPRWLPRAGTAVISRAKAPLFCASSAFASERKA